MSSIVSCLSNRQIVRSSFVNDSINLVDVVNSYKNWVNDDIFIHFVNEVDCLEVSVKSSKRGNDVYYKKLYGKYLGICKRIKSLGGSFNLISTKFIMISLTLRRDINLSEAWLNIGKYFNGFRSNLVKYFGKISFFRCFEAQNDGYPHIHMLLRVNSEVAIRSRRMRDGKYRYVVTNLIREKLRSFWDYGFIDVSGVSDVGQSVRYIGKYIFKGGFGRKDNLGLSLMWIFGKRAFSISRSLIDLTRIKNNSNWKVFGLADSRGIFYIFESGLLKSKLNDYESRFLDNWMKAKSYKQIELN